MLTLSKIYAVKARRPLFSKATAKITLFPFIQNLQFDNYIVLAND